MDIKLKSFSKVGCVAYGLVWLLELITVTATLVAGSIFAALQEMYWAKDYSPDNYYAGFIGDVARYNKMLDGMGIGMIGGSVLALVLLMVLAFMVGRFSRENDGGYHLNWYDRIWSEIHIAIAIGTAILALLPLKELYTCWMRGMYLGVWQWYNPYEEHRIVEDVEFALLIMAEVFLLALVLAALMSLLKKFKAKQFWEKSLLGGVFLLIYRAIKSSDKTPVKVMTLLIAGALLSATWFGLPVVIILIIVFVPKSVKKFMEIKKGVEEVKAGNLTYRIPVEVGVKGIKDEFDKLALNINDISTASDLAVRNELKNQRMKTELISNVSHDLKTPLTSIISYIDLMKKEGLHGENAEEYLDIIDKKTQRLKVLTENLFEAAKASSGAVPVNMELIDLEALLTQSLVEMEERLRNKNLDVKVQNRCSESRIRADGQLMWRVLENLLSNISKYALDNSRVYINMTDLEEGTEKLRAR